LTDRGFGATLRYQLENFYDDLYSMPKPREHVQLKMFQLHCGLYNQPAVERQYNSVDHCNTNLYNSALGVDHAVFAVVV
jgi:hypothetical protein